MESALFFFQLQFSVAVVFILVLRQGMKRLPKIYSYLLWILVFGRLLCPFALESRIGIMPSLKEGSLWMEKAISRQEDALREAEDEKWDPEAVGGIGGLGLKAGWGMDENSVSGLQSGAEALGTKQREKPESESDPSHAYSHRLENLWIDLISFIGERDFEEKRVFLLFWAAGAAAVLGYNAMALVRVRRRLGNARELIITEEELLVSGGKDIFPTKNLYSCEGIGVPFTMGLFRPRIYLPQGIEGAERRYVLCHEGVHVRRRDYLVKNMAFLLSAINWFNPFVWAAFHFLESDMEMSCDEKVVKLMGTDIKKQYSQSLLHFAVERGGIAVTPLTFGQNSVKDRIKNVLSYKNTRKWSIVLGFVIFFAAGAALFTTRAAGPEGNGSEDIHLQDNSGEGDADRGNMDRDDKGTGNPAVGKREGSSGEESQDHVYWSGKIAVNGEDHPLQTEIEIRAEGIYRWAGERWDCLYSGYISPEVHWCDKDGILYFTMDSDHEGDGGEYLVDRIYMLDLKTGELDKDTLGIPEDQARNQNIHVLDIVGGFVILYTGGSDIAIPLVNTGNMLSARDPLWKDKAVDKLNDEERDAYGAALRERILNDSGLILDISNRSLEETFAFLDMDGDGRAERITLSADPDQEPGYYPYDSCRFQVGDSSLTGQAERLSNCIWAFSPDGSRIILALYSDGISWNPRTIFFSYEESELREIGSIPNYIEDCVIGDGQIQGYTVLYDAMMPLYMKIIYEINRDGMLEQADQDTYELIAGEAKLLVELPVHDSPEGQMIYSMAPQMVQFVEIDSAYEWIRLKGENGEEGWFKVDGDMRSRIAELDMGSEQVFELYYAG